MSFSTQAVEYDNSFSNTKYCLAQMMHEVLETPEGIKLRQSRTMKELWYISYMSDIPCNILCMLTCSAAKDAFFSSHQFAVF